MRRLSATAVTAILLAGCAATAHADWSGDGLADVLAVDSRERVLLYRGDGAGGWLTGTAEPIGTGWGVFTAVLSPGDFSGDDRPDLLVRRTGGALLMYPGAHYRRAGSRRGRHKTVSRRFVVLKPSL